MNPAFPFTRRASANVGANVGARVSAIGTGLAIGLAGLAAQAAPTVYHAVDLQVLNNSAPALSSFGEGIASGGGVAGYAATGIGSEVHAVRHSGGVLQDLGSLGAGLNSWGYGINASGQVIGGSQIVAPNTIPHATIFDGTTIKDIGAAGGTQYASLGLGISNKGNATGIASQYFDGLGGRIDSAFFYDGTTLHDIGTLGGQVAVGRAVNDQGRVAGLSLTGIGEANHAFYYDGQKMIDIGTFGGQNSAAYGINSQGDAVGGAYLASGNGGPDEEEHAFIYRNGQLIDIGTLQGSARSEAHGINDLGWVVGTSSRGDDTTGFLFDGQQMFDLAGLITDGFNGWQITEISGINDAGQIVGTGSRDGVTHAFRFDPFQSSSVPEPASLALVLAALGVMALAGSRRPRAI